MSRGRIQLWAALWVVYLVWGSTYLGIKLAVRTLPPLLTAGTRFLAAAAILAAILAIARRSLRVGRREALAAAGLGVALLACGVGLVHVAETRIDSGVAAIGNASMPIFVALLALRFRKSERATGSKAVGVVLGLIGVGVLTGINPQGGWAGVVGTLAVILASISYAASTLYIQTLLDTVHNDVLAAASVTWGAIFLTPLGAAQAPSHVPSWGVIGSVLALALLGTVAGQLLYFRLVYRYGSARASLVVYLLPVTALFYGALLLGESITASAIVGLVLILTGTALGSGVLRMPRRAAVATSP